MMKTIMRGILLFLSLGASLTVSFAKPAPTSPKKKSEKLVYAQDKGLTLEQKKQESSWVTLWWIKGIKRPEARYDASIIQELLYRKDNLNKLGRLPSRFRALIMTNEQNYYFPTKHRAKQDVWCLYEGYSYFKVIYDTQQKYPIRIYWDSLSGNSQMAIFEKPKEIPQIICVPEKLVQNISAEDQKYIDELLAVVNENMAFIGHVPFYKPDLNAWDFDKETAGCFIPEKYLLTGEALDRLKTELSAPNKKYEYVDISHLELQKRLGHPVYRLFTYEGHELKPVYKYQAMYVDAITAKNVWRNVKPGHLKHDDGYPFTRYHGMRYVDSLVQLQPGWDFDDDADMVLQTVREVQYTRAQKSLHIIFDGLKEEFELQKDNPVRKAILTSVIQDVRSLGQKWDKMLQTAIDEGKFLFSLTNPNASRKTIKEGGFVPCRTTWGHEGKGFLFRGGKRTPEEWDAYYKRMEEKKRNKQKTRGSE